MFLCQLHDKCPPETLDAPIVSATCAESLDSLGVKEFTTESGCFTIIYVTDYTEGKRGFKASFVNQPRISKFMISISMCIMAYHSL